MTRGPWADEQTFSISDDATITVRRDGTRKGHDADQEMLERLVVTPSQPWTSALEVRCPFRLDLSTDQDASAPSTAADTAANQSLALVLPLRNGWAKRMELGEGNISAEYRLADTLTGNETPELALPVIQVDGPGHRQVAVMADPRFSALFRVRARGQKVEGEIRYRFCGDRVPIKDAETRWIGIWRAPAVERERPFGASIDAFFRMMLPDVPPGPAWLHDIAMVGYDYLSDEGQGWDRDVAKLAEWLPREERQRVALCFHGWYDGIGSYSFDEATGRMKDHWVAMPKTRKVALTRELVQQRLGKTPRVGLSCAVVFRRRFAPGSWRSHVS